MVIGNSAFASNGFINFPGNSDFFLHAAGDGWPRSVTSSLFARRRNRPCACLSQTHFKSESCSTYKSSSFQRGQPPFPGSHPCGGSGGVCNDMTRYGSIFMMAAILAGLGLDLYFCRNSSQTVRGSRDTQSKRLFTFEEQQITKLSVSTSGSDVVLTQGANNTWQITSPIHTEAENARYKA